MQTFFNYLNPKAITKKSQISGKGTFVKRKINKEELICIFGGKIFSFYDWMKLPDKIACINLQIHENFFIGPSNEKEIGEGDFVNHSCDANSGIKGQIFLIALKNIRRGEEVTFDYGTVASKPKFKIKCNCGSKNCRKFITSEDWKNPEFQKKYKNYFSDYLKKKIDKITN